DALHATTEDAAALAGLVRDKTGGNPFFVRQFLTALVETGADNDFVRYDAAERRWQWDLDRITAHGFSDDVVELMAEKLARFGSNTREALAQLACLGSTVKIANLVTIRGDDE